MIENEVLVSVIMPVYNGMPLIKQSIDSLLRQTYNNWECIIINDGSTDDTKVYIESLSDKRFRVYSFEKNLGRPYARQKGLDMATGKYLAMLDADDIYHPHKLEIQVNLLENNPDVSLVSSGMCLYGTTTDVIRILGQGKGVKEKYKGNSAFPVCHASSMLRNSLAKCYKYDTSLDTGEDIDFLKKYLKGKFYIKQQEVLYYYSMFDSVSKNKMLHNTLTLMKHALKEQNVFYLLKLFLKLIVQCIAFPFLNQQAIISKKGKVPNINEVAEFRKYCFSYIGSVNINNK